MNKAKLFVSILGLLLSITIISCKTSNAIKTTAVWVDREKMPVEPIKSVFIIAFTDNPVTRVLLEDNLAAAAEKKGLKAYKSLEVIGPVDMKSIAPVKDVFIKKLKDLNCEAIFTVALVDHKSETRYVPPTDAPGVYSPYSYSPYVQYSGYSGMHPTGPYGGFGGYYGFAIGNLSTPGYYSTDSKYFIEAKLFDLNTDELLLSIQTKAENPSDIEKSCKKYTESVMKAINDLGLRKK